MGTPPRDFNREQSAEYVGVSATKFDQMVADGRMPKPKRIDGRVVWDRLQLDSASQHCQMRTTRRRCLEQIRYVDPTAMVTVKLRYVHQDVDRHGNVRTYFWRKGGPKVRIRESLGSQAFLDVYRSLLAASQSGKLAPVEGTSHLPDIGTYRWLCVEYFKSARFMGLDPRTQKVRRRVLS
jgi:predicted DNA-binding transcriptional regulator AlpA